MFGSGAYGQLGTGGRDDYNEPVLMSMTWSSLLSSSTSSTPSRGSVTGRIPIVMPPAIGSPQYGNLSRGEDDLEEDKVLFTDVSCGDRHTLTLARRKPESSIVGVHTSIISFGDGLNGRLGHGDESDRLVGALISTCALPPDVSTDILGLAADKAWSNTGPMPTNFTSICAGTTHNLATTSSGQVFSWGSSMHGQLGHGMCESEWQPRQVMFFSNNRIHVSTARCGAAHSLALTRSGAVYVWGRGIEGQLAQIVEFAAVPQLVEVPPDSVQRSTVSGAEIPASTTSLLDRNVVVNTIVAKHNTCLVLDDDDRLFAWGENSAEKLGLPEQAQRSSSNAHPKQVWYMELRASNSNHPTLDRSSLSRVATFRHQVTAAGLAMPRERLEYVQAGGDFTALVFKTKSVAAIGSTVNVSLAPGARKASRLGSASLESVDGCRDGKSGSSWQFSATESLVSDAIPSKESTYYNFMSSYRVVVHVDEPRRATRDFDELSDDEHDEASLENGCKITGSTPRGRQGGFDNFYLDKKHRRWHTNPDAAPPEVKGMGAWLEARSPSPPRHPQLYSFGTAPRFGSPCSKVSEARTSFATAEKDEDEKQSAFQTLTHTLVSPSHQLKSVFGRTLRSASSVRRSIVQPTTISTGVVPTPPSGARKKSISSSRSAALLAGKGKSFPVPHRSGKPNQKQVSTAPFGSSVASRFGTTKASPAAHLTSPLGLNPCAFASPMSPQFSMGGSTEHFSLVIAKRLTHARGPRPGPGTYDRTGG